MKLNSFSLCFILSLCLLYSCKKTALKENFSNPNKTISEKIEAWLSKNPGFSNYQSVKLEGRHVNLAHTLEWASAKYFAESKTHILPVKIESPSAQLPVFKYLVTIMDDDGEVKECNYYNLLTENSTSKASDEKFLTPELFSDRMIPEDFTGAIIKYDLRHKTLLSRHYQAGVLVNKTDNIVIKKNKNLSLPGNFAPLDPDCNYVRIDWYWQTWVNGILVYEEYVGSSLVIVCEGGGGGGNGGGNSGPCTLTATQAQAQLNAITVERFNYSMCTPPIEPPQFSNYPRTSPKTCSVEVVTLHFFLGISASYTAYFTGSIKKMSQNEPWKWQTFQYSNTNMTDGTIPPCFNMEKTITANCVISQDRLYANSQVNYNFIAKLFCLSGWQPGAPYSGSFSHTFDAN